MCAVPTPHATAAPNLIANFLPVAFRGGTFRGGVTPFDSAEQMAELRGQLRGTHVVRRDARFRIWSPLWM